MTPEQHADAILRAAGSSLANYTMPGTRAAILAAVRDESARAAIDAMPDREAAYEDGYTAGELKWADAMDKQIGIEESLRTHLAASQADVARLRYALKQIQDYEHSASQMKYIARAAIRDTQP